MSSTGGPCPVLDQARLDDLAHDLGHPCYVLAIAEAFLDLLPERLRRITAAVRAGQCEAAHVALLSLADCSGTLGALRLEHDARRTDHDVQARHLADARASLPQLAHDAEVLTHELRAFLRAAPPSRARTGPAGH